MFLPSTFVFDGTRVRNDTKKKVEKNKVIVYGRSSHVPMIECMQ